MIAIRISGIGSPPNDNAKTSLVFGQGTRVDARTFMYPVRKHEKMNVSLRRKIHIMALPHGTWNVCRSADQSVAMPRTPGSCPGAAAVTSCAISYKVLT